MILQLGALLAGGNVLGGALSSLFQQVGPTVLSAGLDIGKQFVTGLVTRELNRSDRNDQQDAIKAALRAAANAVTPVVAPGQSAVFSGGPPTGTAFQPPTLIPPSIQPPQRVLQTDPDFFPRVSQFTEQRRPPGLFTTAQDFTQPAFFGQLLRGGVAAARRLGQQFDPRTPIGRRMLGTAGGAVALETGAAVIGESIFSPGVATAPSFQPFPQTGDPLRIGGAVPQTIAPTPTGLPAVGRYQREANGCVVQWYFFDGNQMTPIDRAQADMVRRDSIYRLDVFRGKFIKLKSRRMNPMNVGAFFRAGRRVDAGERICRKMFSEKRKQKTGTVRRKSRSRKK